MGQDISKSITPPPLTFQDCLVNDQIDLPRYLYYCRRSDNMQNALYHRRMLSKKRQCQHFHVSPNKRQKTQRSVKKHKLMVRDKDGLLREMVPTDTLWYLLYISNPPNNQRMLKLFRNRFRLPYDSFVELSETISTHPIFKRWTRSDAVGIKP